MSYLACHVQKFKMNDVRGCQIHNQRESEHSKNQDIDRSQTSQNYDLHTTGDINYRDRVQDRLETAYRGSQAVRRDAVVMVGVLVTSDKEFFDKLPPERQKEYFQTAYDHVADQYGKENIISARVHMDEKVPHMHLTFVPITEDGRLCAKELTDRQHLLELQKELPKRLQDKGFDIERGITSDKKHVDTHEHKRRELIQQEKFVEQRLDRIAKMKNELEQAHKEIQFYWGNYEEITKRAKTTSILGFQKRVELEPKDYEKLLEGAKKGASAEHNLGNMTRVVRDTESRNKNLEAQATTSRETKEKAKMFDKIREKHPDIVAQVQQDIKIEQERQRQAELLEQERNRILKAKEQSRSCGLER